MMQWSMPLEQPRTRGDKSTTIYIFKIDGKPVLLSVLGEE